MCVLYEYNNCFQDYKVTIYENMRFTQYCVAIFAKYMTRT